MSDKKVLVKVENLQKHYSVGKKQVLKAVDDVSFEIYEGETLGLVGESGCGKTTCGKTVLGLHKATGGAVYYDDKNIFSMTSNERTELTKKAQFIFQDPYASLDPRMTVGDIIGEGIKIHNLCSGQEKRDKISKLLNIIGLNQEHISRFPHEFSGGQRQRIGIARALAVDPKFIVCDEPISALDVSIQAQIVNLLIRLQREMGLTYLFIAHDLSMVRHISDRIAVMYLGNIIEIAESEELFNNPYNPYTQALLSAIPVPDPIYERNKNITIIKGEISGNINTKLGCKFAPRCKFRTEICDNETPILVEVAKNHKVACHNIQYK